MLKDFRRLFKNRTGDISGFRAIEPFVELLRETGVYPPFETISAGVNEPICHIGDQPFLLFCANNYFSLSEHAAVKRAAHIAIEQYGLGPGGSRVIAGNVDIIEQLESDIAELTGTEDCLTFPTGYMANVSLFQALLEPLILGRPCARGTSAIFLDEYNHGSVWDGLHLTSAPAVTYAHDDLDQLDQLLGESSAENKLVVTEGVYSLEGRIADIPAYIDISRKHDAWLVVDDAHGIGVIGERGGGIGEHFDCASGIDLLMGSMDKAMGGTGGFLCGRKSLIDYLRVSMRSSMLSSALPCAMAGGMIQSIKMLRDMQQTRQQLFEKSQYLRDALRAHGFTVLGEDNIPALALLIGDEALGVEFNKRLYERGIFCSLVRWPAVPPGQARFRVIVMARHTQQHLDTFVDACVAIADELEMMLEPAVQATPLAGMRGHWSPVAMNAE